MSDNSDLKKNNRIAGSSIDSLWQKYWTGRANGNGQEPKNQLIEHYSPIVKYPANRIYKRLPKGAIELDDLISMGIFGLIDAIEVYDSKRNVKFETYAPERIRGAILDGIREMDWIPRVVRKRTNQIKKIKQDFRDEKGHFPNNKELVNYLTKHLEDCLDKSSTAIKKLKKDNSLKKRRFYVRLILEDSCPPKLISLDNASDQKDEIEKIQQPKYFIVDKKAEDPVLKAQKESLKSLLTKGLTRAERLIIALYYYEEMTMEEIGKTLDLSESRVSQLHSSIIVRLKAELTNQSRKHQRELEFMISTSN